LSLGLSLLLLLLLLLSLLSAGYQYDVSGLFGAAPPSHPSYDKDGTITGVPVDLFNRKLQVGRLWPHGGVGV
jgi:hypothetical protein